MSKLEISTKKVMEQLNELGYKKSSLADYRNCYKFLEECILKTEVNYSFTYGMLWLTNQQHLLTENKKNTYRRAINKLNDVYENGNISFHNLPKEKATYSQLHLDLKLELDVYLNDCKLHYSEKYLPSIHSRCSRFLIFCQKKGVLDIVDISFETIKEFHKTYPYICMKEKSMCEAVVINFLLYLAEIGRLSFCFSIFLGYLKNYSNEIFFALSDFTNHQYLAITNTKKTCLALSLNDFWQQCTHFFTQYKEMGYSKSMRCICRNALSRLYVFLSMNELPMHLDIAMIWLNVFSKPYSLQWYEYRRILLLFNKFFTLGELCFDVHFNTKTPIIDGVAKWCKPTLQDFLLLKEREGKVASTICLYRSACVRFCRFLNNLGMTSFYNLTATIIKEFNIYDQHKTPEGKNAYNVRIRKFLLYLGENNLIQNAMLYLALPSVAAPKERIIVVLNKEELQEIRKFHESSETDLELRDSGMLLLGVRMGMRENDIINLQCSDINWKTTSIHFMQSKTKRELRLPMPIDVANALYKYIIKGRRNTGSPYLFLSTRAPFYPLSRSTCGDAMGHALPMRNVAGSGFHVTRKTFATEMLRHGNGIDIITDALGHSNSSNLHVYLSLDDKRMAMCSLSLEETNIDLKGGFHHV